MENGNFWDWDNEDERRVSSVYRDMETQEVQAGNIEVQSAESQEKQIQHNESQNVEVQNNETENSQALNNQPQNTVSQETTIEKQDVTPPETVTETAFILVDEPQNTIQDTAPQNEPSFIQPEFQPEFQPVVPVKNTQQNQAEQNQNTNQNKNAEYSSNFSQKDISENKVVAMAAYLLGPVGIIIALLAARDSAYTAFHVRQALKLTVSSVVLEIAAAIFTLFGIIPFVGIIFKLVLVIIGIAWFAILVLRLIAIAQVCDGEAREPAFIKNLNFFK